MASRYGRATNSSYATSPCSAFASWSSSRSLSWTSWCFESSQRVRASAEDVVSIAAKVKELYVDWSEGYGWRIIATHDICPRTSCSVKLSSADAFMLARTVIIIKNKWWWSDTTKPLTQDAEYILPLAHLLLYSVITCLQSRLLWLENLHWCLMKDIRGIPKLSNWFPRH